MFNPNPRIDTRPITPRFVCHVVDDALREPEAWVAHAVEQRARFGETPGNAFPGPELALPDDARQQFADFFSTRIRARLGARRVLETKARLSLATLQPHALQPPQWFCHVDNMDLAPGRMIAACVLYLFRDPLLGGTAFYMPRKPPQEIARLAHASSTLPPERFAAEFGITPGYMTASNDWFQKVAAVEPRWNRMVFYSGTILHSADIAHPERLADDPRSGRLTMNGFFTCTRSLSPP